MRVAKLIVRFYLIYIYLLLITLGSIFGIFILDEHDNYNSNEFLYFIAAFHSTYSIKIVMLFIFLTMHFLSKFDEPKMKNIAEIGIIVFIILLVFLIFGRIFGFYYTIGSLIFLLIYNLLKNLHWIETPVLFPLGIVFTFSIIMNYGLNNVFGIFGLIALILLFFLYYFILTAIPKVFKVI
jgi:hypothetical protein